MWQDVEEEEEQEEEEEHKEEQEEKSPRHTERIPSSHLFIPSSQASGELRDIPLPPISPFIPVLRLSNINRTN